MGKLYPNPSECEKETVVILHIIRARAIFLLFYDDKDTEIE